MTYGTDVRPVTGGVCEAKCDDDGLRDRSRCCAGVCVCVCVCVCVFVCANAGECGFSDESAHRIIVTSHVTVWHWTVVSMVFCSLGWQAGGAIDISIQCEVHDRYV